MSLVFGIGDAVFFPAAMVITPEIVPLDLLPGASALTNTSIQLGRVLIGPAIGGVLVGVLGAAWGFGVDAASFAISAVLLLAMTASSKPATETQGSPSDGIREGLRYLFSERWLWVTSLAAALGNFVASSPLGATVSLLVKHVLHGNGVQLGLVLAASGLGGLIASVLLGHRNPPRHRLVHMWLGWGLSGVGVLGLGLDTMARAARCTGCLPE